MKPPPGFDRQWHETARAILDGPDTMRPLNIPGIPNGWILDPVIWRGAQPAAESYALLAAAGCKSVMNLRPASEVPDEPALVAAAGMVYYDQGWDGILPPTIEMIIDAISIIEASREGQSPIFVHCEHGRDRTGTLCACWRVKEYRWPVWRAQKEAMAHGELELWMALAVSEFEDLIHA